MTAPTNLNEAIDEIVGKIREESTHRTHQAFLLGWYSTAYRQLLYELPDHIKEKELRGLEQFYQHTVKIEKKNEEKQ